MISSVRLFLLGRTTDWVHIKLETQIGFAIADDRSVDGEDNGARSTGSAAPRLGAWVCYAHSMP